MNRTNILAIDFGTSNSSAAVMIDGNLRLVKDPGKQGYSFPSSIYIDKSGKVLIGHFAESKKVKDSRRYHNEIKPDLIQEHPYLLGQNGEYKFTARQLITEILKFFKQEAEKITVVLDKGEINDVVITIPATYRKNKRDAMIEAAKNAGFTSVQLIEEPVAAAIYYHQQNPATFKEGNIILIYDLGGGTFDATLIKKWSNGFEVRGQPVGIENCGGINFDRAIFQHLKASCSQQLQEKLSAKGNSPEKKSLLDFCRHIKHQFSGTTEAIGQIPIDHQLYELSCDDFNRMIDVYVEQTIVCCEDLIKSAGVELQDISKVLMVGGSCRLPYIQESVKKRLQSSVLLIDEPELAVCQGAVILKEKLKNSKASLEERSSNIQLLKNQAMTNYKKQSPVERGDKCLKDGDLEQAIYFYKKELQQNKDNIKALFSLGLAYFNQENKNEARKTWNKVIKLDRDYFEYRMSQVKTNLEINRNMSSIENLLEFLKQLFNPLNAANSIQDLFNGYRQKSLPIEPQIVDTYTYQEFMNYFRHNRPRDERVKKGVIIQEDKLISLLFLDESNQIVYNSKNLPYGRCFRFFNLDEKLEYLLKDKEVYYVEY